MNTKRIIFWGSFIIILGLIIWGLIVAMNKAPSDGLAKGTPMPITEIDHVRGPANAPVTIIEYSDLQCPACQSYYPIIERLLTEASTTVRFVYRHYPLYPQPHKNAMLASQAVEAAALQGKFWEMLGLLFENQRVWEFSATPLPLFEGYATEIGLDLVAYHVALESEAVKAHIERDREDGVSIGVMGTPTFFVNGKAIVNPTSYDAFKTLVDEAAASSYTN